MDAIFIANYIIDYTNKINKLINNMKLQKLLYYAYSAVLIETGEELFDDPIEKWRSGPIVPSVYHEFKGLNARPITADYILKVKIEFIDDETFNLKTTPYDEKTIPHRHKEIIRRVIDHLINYNPLELVDITRNESIYAKDEETIKKLESTFAIRYTNDDIAIRYTNDDILEQYANYPETAIWLTEQPIDHPIPNQNIDSDSKQYAIIQYSNNRLELLSVHKHFEKAYHEIFERFINRINANCHNGNMNIINLPKDYQHLDFSSTKRKIIVDEIDGEYKTYIHIDLEHKTIDVKTNNSNNHYFELKVQPLPETKS